MKGTAAIQSTPRRPQPVQELRDVFILPFSCFTKYRSVDDSWRLVVWQGIATLQSTVIVFVVYCALVLWGFYLDDEYAIGVVIDGLNMEFLARIGLVFTSIALASFCGIIARYVYDFLTYLVHTALIWTQIALKHQEKITMRESFTKRSYRY